MTEDNLSDKPTSTPSPHQFQSPLNSNAIVTVRSASSEAPLTKCHELLGNHVNCFTLVSTADCLKVKFIDKEDAKKFEGSIRQLDENQKLIVSVQYDALTFPGNIYVRGLTPELDTQDLVQLFEPFGEITSCKIVVDDFGRSKGYGFVNFAEGVSADEAIEKLNGMLVNGSKLYLNHHIAKKERLERLDFEREHFTNLYVKNIPETLCTEEKLKEWFGEFGEVSSVFIPVHKNENAPEPSKKFAFVNMKTHESAVDAIDALSKKEIEEGITLTVSRAQRRDERHNSPPSQSHKPSPPTLQHSLPPTLPMSLSVSPTPLAIPTGLYAPQPYTSAPPPGVPVPPHHPASTPAAVVQQLANLPLPTVNQQQSNLYIKNLSPNITDDTLFELFAPFGIIVSARIMTNDHGEPRGYGFVCFKTMPEAAAAIVAMDGKDVDGMMIHVSYAQRNGKRAQKAYLNYYGAMPPMSGPMQGAIQGRGGYLPYGQQVVNGNGGYQLPMMPRYGGGLSNGRAMPRVKKNRLTEKETEIVELGAEIAIMEKEEDKRAKFIDALIAPKIAERNPTFTESQLFDKCEEVLGRVLKKFEGKEDSEEFWLDVITHWTENEEDVAELMSELKL